MATGHILPGYGDPVSRLRRARSAGCYPLDNATLLDLQNASRLKQKEFEQIRENARQLWSVKSPRATTYDTFFSDGNVTEVTMPRPTSSHRHNNPHPPQVFLTNRLHYIEGYHNPDTTLGKGMYRIDASLSKSEQEKRRAPRLKYVARPDPALVNSYKDPYGFKSFLPPREAQAAEAWVKLADDADKDKVLDSIQENGERMINMGGDNNASSSAGYPSMHRWMKMSGAQEYDATNRIMHTLNSNPMRQQEYYRPERETMGHRCRQDIRSAGLYRFQPRLRRDQYSMHPDWPTSLPHHQVP